MRIRLAALWLLAVLPSPALAEGSPFTVPPSQVVARVRTVAIAPSLVRAPMALPADLPDRVEEAARAALASVGLATVPASTYAAVWRPLSESVGGTFDAATGEPLDTATSVRDHAFRELHRLHHVDAVVEIAIVGGALPFDIEFWSWRGYWKIAGQRMQIGGKDVSVDNGMLAVDGIWALLRISDTTQVPLYETRGPLDWTEFRTPAGITKRPPPEILAPERFQAIAQLLEPFAQAYRPAPPKKRR